MILRDNEVELVGGESEGERRTTLEYGNCYDMHDVE